MNQTHTQQHWQDSDWHQFTELLKHTLVRDETTVVFTKLDGTQRTMRCTLNSNLLPTPVITEAASDTKPVRKQSDQVMVVYDLDKQAWRSFKIRSVLSAGVENSQ
jgi:hypothetical protein